MPGGKFGGLNILQLLGGVTGVAQGLETRQQQNEAEKLNAEKKQLIDRIIAEYGGVQGMGKFVPGHPEIRTATDLTLYNAANPNANLSFKQGSLGQEESKVRQLTDEYHATNQAGQANLGNLSNAELAQLSDKITGQQATDARDLDQAYGQRTGNVMGLLNAGYSDLKSGYGAMGNQIGTGYGQLGNTVQGTINQYASQSDPMYAARTGQALGTLDTSQGVAQGELTGLRRRVMGDLANVGRQQQQDIRENYGKAGASAQANLTKAGLGASSLGYGAGIANKRAQQADLNRLQESLLQQRAGYDTSISGQIAEGARQGGVTRATMGANLSADQLANLANIANSRAAYQSQIGQAGLGAQQAIGLSGLGARERGIASGAGAYQQLSGEELANRDLGNQRALALANQFGQQQLGNAEYWRLQGLNADLAGKQSGIDLTQSYGNQGRQFARDVLNMNLNAEYGTQIPFPDMSAYYQIPGMLTGLGNQAVAQRQADIQNGLQKTALWTGAATSFGGAALGAGANMYGANQMANAYKSAGQWSPWQVGQQYPF